jgi:hypothetical protein
MAKKSRMSVLKRQREARKAEKAALKRERRHQRKEDGGPGEPTQTDMAGYLGDAGEEEVVLEEEEEQPAP